MAQVNAKVYFDKITGEILLLTPEMQGDIEKTTKERDAKAYPSLQDKDIDAIDYIELEYGTLESTFTNSKSYSINLITKQLEVIYYTQEELDAMQQQKQESQDLNCRVSDIIEYLSSSDEITISNIENSILEIELNKTINGGM